MEKNNNKVQIDTEMERNKVSRLPQKPLTCRALHLKRLKDSEKENHTQRKTDGTDAGKAERKQEEVKYTYF